MDKIYKYVFPERVDILENNLIRFTQPKYLNDPFDMYLSFRKLIPKNEFDEKFNSEQLYEKFISTFNENLRKNNLPYSFEQLVESQGKDIEQVKNEFIEGINTHTSLITSENYFAKTFINEEINKFIGVLSLTETPDNIPMWSHYAKVHQGFVIIFNAKHSFFDGGFLTDKDFGVLKKVSYRKEKHVLDSFKEISSDPLFQKHKSWEYENEWRMILPLDKKTELKYPDIYLFKMPSDIIIGIILGFRCAENLKSYIFNLREKKTDLKHIEIFQAVPSLDKYKMVFNKLI